MERFDFSFGLHLGGRLHSHNDNLSKDLKGTKVAAVSGQGLTLAYLTKEKTAKDHFRRVYCEAVDLMVSAIYQESFSSYAQMETLLVKAANGDDYEAEFKFLEASYREDVDTGALPGHATKYLGSYVRGEDSMF